MINKLRDVKNYIITCTNRINSALSGKRRRKFFLQRIKAVIRLHYKAESLVSLSCMIEMSVKSLADTAILYLLKIPKGHSDCSFLLLLGQTSEVIALRHAGTFIPKSQLKIKILSTFLFARHLWYLVYKVKRQKTIKKPTGERLKPDDGFG